MLVAPVGMAAAGASPHGSGKLERQAADHCAKTSDRGPHAPAEQSQCSGVCSAVEVAVPHVAMRVASRRAVAPIPAMSSLTSILLEGNTPPPRFS